METISVIIPVFNAQDYLHQCLDSVCQQTYTQLEILLINDGSSDDSALICEEYRQKDPRIRVFHKPLGGSGVGATRNTALSLATGDYILFVDNDDWLESHHIESLYTSLKETKSDIAISNFTQFDDQRKVFQFHLRPEDDFQETYTPAEWFRYQYEGHFSLSQCFTVPWAKLYKRSLLEDITYPENEKVEDDYTTWKIYLLADQIVYSNTASYYHRKRESSVTKTVDVVHVFPLRSIEERITLLSLVGLDISAELSAYRWRLEQHKEAYLTKGLMQDYKHCQQTLKILEKWHIKSPQ